MLIRQLLYKLFLKAGFEKSISFDKPLYLYSKKMIDQDALNPPIILNNCYLIQKNSTVMLTGESPDFNGKVIVLANSIFSQRKMMRQKLPLPIRYKFYSDYPSFLNNESWRKDYFQIGLLADEVLC